MKQIALILIIFLLLSTSILTISAESSSLDKSTLEKKLDISFLLSRFNPRDIVYNSQKKICSFYTGRADDGFWDFSFSPEDIELKDDAFHRADSSNLSHFTEWWYFDASFDNGYNVQMSVQVMSLLDQDIAVFSRLNIYKDFSLISHKQNTYLFEDFHASTYVPWILLDGKDVIQGYIDRDTGDWTFDISFDMGDTSADLHFVGCTKGYKGVTHGGKWAVILPRANVTGSILVDGGEIEVSGTGYHDHNWEVTAEATLNFGWYWGKINSDTYTIVWADILRTWYWNQPLVVISENNGGYQNIERDDIRFTAGNFYLTNWMIVPHSFRIVVQTENVSLNVQMQSLDMHYNSFIGIINYWRYHMKCTGYITVGSQTEIIDDIIIAEFLRFRPY